MDCRMVTEKIVNWLTGKLNASGQKGFVVGLSGGVDSAVVASLCAMTGMPVKLLILPLSENCMDTDTEICERVLSPGCGRAIKFAAQLAEDYHRIEYQMKYIDRPVRAITNFFDLKDRDRGTEELAFANMCSRIRMTCLYTLANLEKHLVVGTGNKVEDFGLFFYTKYGDGGVDLSPIADLYKSEVVELAKFLRVPEEIYNAVPSDELWKDNRSDESQLGASYADFETVMKFLSGEIGDDQRVLSSEFIDTCSLYHEWHDKGKHKSEPIPVCIIGHKG